MADLSILLVPMKAQNAQFPDWDSAAFHAGVHAAVFLSNVLLMLLQACAAYSTEDAGNVHSHLKEISIGRS